MAEQAGAIEQHIHVSTGTEASVSGLEPTWSIEAGSAVGRVEVTGEAGPVAGLANSGPHLVVAVPAHALSATTCAMVGRIAGGAVIRPSSRAGQTTEVALLADVTLIVVARGTEALGP